jgi:hypothetical protein
VPGKSVGPPAATSFKAASDKDFELYDACCVTVCDAGVTRTSVRMATRLSVRGVPLLYFVPQLPEEVEQR